MTNDHTSTGLVDLQVNGYMGVSFSDPELTIEQVRTVTDELAAAGTAAYLPTLMTISEEVYARNLPIIAEVMKEPGCSKHILGVHLEGPFISDQTGAVGAHDRSNVCAPDIEYFKRLQLYAQGSIRLLTVAPESDGAAELIDFAAGQGTTVSVGHSLATPDCLARAVDAGAASLTHLGNGIPNELPRHDNLIWAGLAEDRLSAMFIADGHHLPAGVLKVMVRAKGLANIILVSDASPLAGMEPGKYFCLGNDCVLEESGRLHNPEKECLVGSSASLLECLNYMVSLNVAPPNDLLACATSLPLELIGLAGVDIDTSMPVLYSEATDKFEICQT